MKNLKIFKARNYKFNQIIIGYCIDADNAALYILTNEFKLFKTSTTTTNLLDENIKEINYSFINNNIITDQKKNPLTNDDVLLVEFIVENGSIFIALKSGLIIRIGVSSFSPPSQCLYTFEKNLSSIKLSPVQDLIAIADVDNNIYIMSIDCDILHSSNALTQNDSLHKPVGVGWGSKETQFFGLDGRPSKEKQTEDHVILNDEELLKIKHIESSDRFNKFRKSQERNTVIDWRGDAQFIATLTHIYESDKHYLKVWNRNLELQYMSDQLVTIERGLLSWIPNGQYVCCAQKRERINDIALFEKNGMVHQRITLPSIMSNTYIKTIAWSPDSKIFAIIVNQFTTLSDDSNFTPILMLYSMQNFHYYLKYAINLGDNCDYQLKWDPISQNRLHSISSEGHYIDYYCSFEATYSDKYSTVAVIDGNCVKLTPMEYCNIPPPMSALSIKLEKSIIHSLALNPCQSSNIFIFTLDNHLIVTSPENININNSKDSQNNIIFCLENSRVKQFYDEIQNFNIYKFQDSQFLQNYTVIRRNMIVASRTLSNITQLLEIYLSSDNQLEVKIIKEFERKRIVYISRDNFNEPEKLILMFDDMSSVILNLNNGNLEDLIDIIPTSTRSLCNYLNVQTIITKPDNSYGFISLTQDLTLRFKSRIIATNCCTSFRVTKNFLVHTNTDNTMHFILLENLYKEVLGGDCIDSWSQQIEIGGTLVVVSERESKVILQMPRGNLEILHPRVLIFSLLTKLLDEEDYISAMKLARRHRLSMNFLADYLLRLAESPAEKIFHKFTTIISSNDPALLSLFITELEDVDTMTQRYDTIIKHLPERKVNLRDVSEELIYKDKTNKVCQYIIESLTHASNNIDENLLKPRLLCLLKSKPKRTGDALKIVKNLPKENQNEALRFMLYFIDIDQLFNDALCTYDTNITLMVANASHKDPKEYLALLNDFDKIQEESMRCFKIDMHVKRYTEALNHLIDIMKKKNDAEIEKQVIDLINSHRLYKHAISLLPSISNFAQLNEKIWSNYGDYLFQKKYYFESGSAYSKAFALSKNEEHLLAGLRAYSLVNDWEKSLALITRHNFISDSTKEKFLSRIIDQLENEHYYELAYSLNLTNTTLLDLANKNISKGSWYRAEFCFNRCRLPRDKFLSDIKLVLPEKAKEMLTELNTSLQETKQQFERLKILITTFQSRKLVEYNADNYISDSLSTIDGSETSSTISGSTAGKNTRSGASSIKTRNTSRSNISNTVVKQKRINLKVGSRNEDLALILAIQKYISEQKVNQKRALDLASSLYEYCDQKFAMDTTEQINDILLESYNFSKEILNLLWPCGPQYEQKFSLYRRFGNLLSSGDGPYENVDFEVLIKPNIPNNLLCYNL